MKFSQFASALTLASGAVAQVFAPYTDSNGIKFWQATFSTTLGDGKAQWGMALPAATETGMTNEYIGRIVVPKVTAGTWMGMSHMSEMTSSLLLLTWLNGDEVMTSFRYATGYTAPDIYTGNATLTQISSTVNDTHYELTYRCESCWSWEQSGVTGAQVPATTSGAAQLMGWAQATNAPTTPTDSDSAIKQHANDGIFGAVVASARNADYTSWISLATASATASAGAATATGNSTGTASSSGTAAVSSAVATATSAACPATNALANTTWDYIIVGAGAGGIPMADKLSEAGKSVLLIEKGPPSSGRWGGSMKPDWLNGTNLTRFDVPGLDNEIWEDSAGIACEDYSVMAGCVLGGGTAVNAGLWWRANPEDFDYNFPTGWKASDVEPAIGRVFDRIPFTERPSTDGVLYKPCGYDIVGGALAAAGWQNVSADEVPAKKNFTFSHPDQMFSHGERGGPMATYLVTAHARKNFKLIMNTAVNRVVRDGSSITGVEVQAFLKGGYCGTINVTPGTGRVILSAGAFGTPKILFRSGIGPQDQLEIVKGAEGSKMVNSSQWINLPVGHNLDDHTNTDIVITHPNVSFYDFYGAYDKPITADKEKYLNNRTGILTQSAPNLAVVFWEEIMGEDGIKRQLQYTARVEGGHDVESKKAMVISQYLGRGAVSRGRTTITAALDMTVSTVPYLHNKYDVAAVATGIDNLIQSLKKDPQIKIAYGPTNETTAEFLANYPVTTGERSANHWMGSCKMGLDSGLVNNGSSVVDTNAKVYGTDNLFVVDASIFPGMVSTNPSALIVSAAEHASELILALTASNTSAIANTTTTSNSTAPYGTGRPLGTASPYGTGKPWGTGSPYTKPSGTAPFSAGVSAVAPSSAGVKAVSSSKCTKDITVTRSRSATSLNTQAQVATSSPSAPAGGPASYSRPAAGFSYPSNSTLAGTTAISGPTATGSGYASTGYASATGTGGSVAQYERCGGIGYTGSTTCVSGLTCKEWNPYYSQCLPASS